MSELLDIATRCRVGQRRRAGRSVRRPRDRDRGSRLRRRGRVLHPSGVSGCRCPSSSTASRATPMPAPSTTPRCRRPSARPVTTPRSPNPTSSTARRARRRRTGVARTVERHRGGVPYRGQDRPRDRARAGGARSRHPDLGHRVGRIHRHGVRVGGCHLDGYRRLPPARPVATSPCTRSPKPMARPRPVSGSRSAATRASSTRPSPPPMRLTAPLGFLGHPSQGARLTVVFDPWVTAQFLGIVGHTLTGEAVLKGRSMFADRLGDVVANPMITLVDDATDPASFIGERPRRRGHRHPPHPLDRRR